MIRHVSQSAGTFYCKQAMRMTVNWCAESAERHVSDNCYLNSLIREEAKALKNRQNAYCFNEKQLKAIIKVCERWGFNVCVKKSDDMYILKRR